MLRHQLRLGLGLRSNGRYFLRPSNDRFLGLFRRVQQNHTLSVVSGLSATQNHTKCINQLKEDCLTTQEGIEHQVYCWNLRDHEPWIRRKNITSG